MCDVIKCDQTVNVWKTTFLKLGTLFHSLLALKGWSLCGHETCLCSLNKGKGKINPLQARLWPRGGRGMALLFQDLGARRGWVVSSTPWPHFTLGKDPVPIVQEAGLAPGPVRTGGKSHPHRDSIPTPSAHGQSLYWLSYQVIMVDWIGHLILRPLLRVMCFQVQFGLCCFGVLFSVCVCGVNSL